MFYVRWRWFFSISLSLFNKYTRRYDRMILVRKRHVKVDPAVHSSHLTNRTKNENPKITICLMKKKRREIKAINGEWSKWNWRINDVWRMASKEKTHVDSSQKKERRSAHQIYGCKIGVRWFFSLYISNARYLQLRKKSPTIYRGVRALTLCIPKSFYGPNAFAAIRLTGVYHIKMCDTRESIKALGSGILCRRLCIFSPSKQVSFTILWPYSERV